MAIETRELTRAFRYNSVDLQDPGPTFTLEQVRDFYATMYPEIVSAAIEGPEQKDDTLVYTFRRAVGTKGADLRNRLESLVKGIAPATDAGTLDTAFVEQHAGAFVAWLAFVKSSHTGAGEPVPAPAALLAPLP